MATPDHKDPIHAACTWTANTSEASPHATIPVQPTPKIMDSILDNIGNTPLVRINAIAKEEGIKCELLAKCEYFNAGGSVKDRIGKRMVMDAESAGRIKKGDTLIEPTSGNTGIGMALASALLGYKMVITLPEKMSQEKVDVLKALGAEIIRTPTEAAFDSPESHIGVAARLNKEIKDSHILDQYSNPSNPLAHYDGTAEELLAQCDGKIDYLVVSAGTGGTITGLSRKLKEKIPNIQVIGVDPHGSILALPESLNGQISSYQVEGIGYDFIPRVLDRSLIDQWVKTEDKESFTMARRLIKKEGLLCGGSSGSAMVAAIKIAKQLPAGKRVVVILPDSVRNYMTKFLNDGWMIKNGFMEVEEQEAKKHWWSAATVSELKLPTPVTVGPQVTCGKCVELLTAQGFDQLPVVDDSGSVVGMVTVGNLSSQMASGRVQAADPISKCVFKNFTRVTPETSLAHLSQTFDRDHYAMVVTTQQRFTSADVPQTTTMVVGIATRIDLLNYITKNAPQQ